MAHENNKHWARKWLRGEPHQIIGRRDNPYLLRWYILPRNPLVNLYLHKFLRSDPDVPHDHPWWFASLILRGIYLEHRKGRPLSVRSYRRAGSIAFRPAESAHSVQLARRDGIEQPCWSLILTGRRRRPWGFHCLKGWVHWETFTATRPDGTSVGCGES